MPRPRTVPDRDVFLSIRKVLSEQGEKAAAFGTIARITGLAAPTLVQRYDNRAGMIRAALLAGWQDLHVATLAADAEHAEPHTFLKSLSDAAAAMTDPPLMALTLRDGPVREAAENWRAAVETALGARLGQGAKAKEAASLLFAAWQGQLCWLHTGGKGFRLKDAVKRLT